MGTNGMIQKLHMELHYEPKNTNNDNKEHLHNIEKYGIVILLDP